MAAASEPPMSRVTGRMTIVPSAISAMPDAATSGFGRGIHGGTRFAK